MTPVVRTGPPDTARSGSTAGVVVARVSVPFDGRVFVGEVTVDPDELLTGPECARLLEIDPATWRSYVRKGYIPPADDPGVGPVNRRTPKWRLATVREFKQSRRGQGARTDLRK